MYMELPPWVKYDLTPLGIGMLKQVEPLWFWVAEHASSFEAAQASFDSAAKPAIPLKISPCVRAYAMLKSCVL
jgi:hypothetical protein